MENASGPGYLLKYRKTGEDYIRWDRHNNRGFAHIGFFVFVRSVISFIVYGWLFFEYCCNKTGRKIRKEKAMAEEDKQKVTNEKAVTTPEDVK